jgi:RHS repeat-associated protein
MPATVRRHRTRQAPSGKAHYARHRINSRNCIFHSCKPEFHLGLRPISCIKSLSPNGNRTQENAAPVATYDTQDRLLTWKGNTYTYNPAGDLTGKTNTATNKTTSYTYDAQGNLRKVVQPNQTITYAIDPAGRRTGKSIAGALQWQLVWMSSLRPLARLKANHTLDQTYYYGDKPNVPEAMSTAEGKTYRIVSDQNGSVRLVIDASTGEVAQQIEYDTWGQVTSDTNPGFQPFGFAGGLYDPDTGLTRFGARDYDAETGRWTAKDPILFGGGDSNLYGYVAGDPVNWIDPWGLRVYILGNNPAEHKALRDAFDSVSRTEHGAELINKLEASLTPYIITNDQNGNAYFDPNTSIISIDPNFHPMTQVDTGNSCAVQPAPTDAILGHELGHAATRINDDGPGKMNNVNANENPIRRQLGIPIRLTY